MPKFFNEHVRAHGDKPETLNLAEVGDPDNTLFDLWESDDTCSYVSDEFKSKLKRLISIGRTDTGADNGWGQLWIDTESGKNHRTG